MRNTVCKECHCAWYEYRNDMSCVYVACEYCVWYAVVMWVACDMCGIMCGLNTQDMWCLVHVCVWYAIYIYYIYTGCPDMYCICEGVVCAMVCTYRLCMCVVCACVSNVCCICRSLCMCKKEAVVPPSWPSSLGLTWPLDGPKPSSQAATFLSTFP